MSIVKGITRRARALFWGARVDRELQLEIEHRLGGNGHLVAPARDHLAHRTDHRRAAGRDRAGAPVVGHRQGSPCGLRRTASIGRHPFDMVS